MSSFIKIYYSYHFAGNVLESKNGIILIDSLFFFNCKLCSNVTDFASLEFQNSAFFNKKCFLMFFLRIL